jgi:predicted ATP-dependent Lon-type protease
MMDKVRKPSDLNIMKLRPTAIPKVNVKQYETKCNEWQKFEWN